MVIVLVHEVLFLSFKVVQESGK